MIAGPGFNPAELVKLSYLSFPSVGIKCWYKIK